MQYKTRSKSILPQIVFANAATWDETETGMISDRKIFN